MKLIEYTKEVALRIYDGEKVAKMELSIKEWNESYPGSKRKCNYCFGTKSIRIIKAAWKSDLEVSHTVRQVRINQLCDDLSHFSWAYSDGSMYENQAELEAKARKELAELKAAEATHVAELLAISKMSDLELMDL